LERTSAKEQVLHVLEENLHMQASIVFDLAWAELQQATEAIRASRDKCVKTDRINADLETLHVAMYEAEQDPQQSALLLRLTTRLFVRQVEDAVWRQFQAYEGDFRRSSRIVIQRLGLIDRQALARGRNELRGPKVGDIEKTLINLQVKVNRLQKAASSWIANVHKEQELIHCIVQTPALMSVYPLTQDGASSLEHSMSLLAEICLANCQMQQLLKPSLEIVTASVQSAVCAGFDASDVRAVLEANTDAIVHVYDVHMRKNRR
jgi:hypothetical protein